MLTMMHILGSFTGVDLNGMERRDVIPRVKKVVVQGQNTRENGKFVKDPSPFIVEWHEYSSSS